MQNSDKMTVSVTFTVGELWEAVFGSDGAGMVHWSRKSVTKTARTLTYGLMMKTVSQLQIHKNFRVYEDEEEKWHDGIS
jgi:hypothetical protein